MIAHEMKRQPESVDRDISLSVWLAVPGVCPVASYCYVAGDALTSPFHPYHLRGGFFSVALSVVSLHPAVSWQVISYCSDFPPRRAIVQPTLIKLSTVQIQNFYSFVQVLLKNEMDHIFQMGKEYGR